MKAISLTEAKAAIGDLVKRMADTDAPIDKKIIPLLIGLWRWGIHTTNSCEGHEDDGFGYPWVRIEFRGVGKATNVLGVWTYATGERKPPWIIEPEGQPKIRFADTYKPLSELQSEAVALGEWLQQLPEDFEDFQWE